MNYILHGNDQSRIEHKISSLKQKYHLKQTMVFDAKQTEQADILHEMDSISILDPTKMIVIQNTFFLSSKDPTKYDVSAFVKRNSFEENIIVVYCCPTEKLDRRKKMVKQMIADSTVYRCMALDDRSQKDYIQTILKTKQIDMEPDAFRRFCSCIGYDSLRIENELEKLRIYSQHITLEDVKVLVAPEPINDIFKMVDALFAKNALLLLSLYRNFRRQNMETVAIVGLLAGQIRFLFQIRVLMDQGKYENEIVSLMHAHPYRIKINMQKADRFTAGELLDQLSRLARLDQDMKRGFIDKDEGFEQFVLTMLMQG